MKDESKNKNQGLNQECNDVEQGMRLIELFFRSISALDESAKKTFLPHIRLICVLLDRIAIFQQSDIKNQIMKGYTTHEISHALKVMEYMYKLVEGNTCIKPIDLFYLIAVSICHDLGMIIITDQDVEDVRENKYLSSEISDQSENFAWENVLEAVRRGGYGKGDCDSTNESARIIIRGVHHDFRVVRKKIKWLLKSNGNDKLSDISAQVLSLLAKVDNSILPNQECIKNAWTEIEINDVEIASIIDYISYLCYGHGISVEEIKLCIANQINIVGGVLPTFHPELIIGLLRICDLLDIGHWRVPTFSVAADDTNLFYQAANWFVNNVDIKTNSSCISGASKKICIRAEKNIYLNIKSNGTQPLNVEGIKSMINNESPKVLQDAKTNETVITDEWIKKIYVYLLEYCRYIEFEIINFHTLTSSNPMQYETIAPRIGNRVCVLPYQLLEVFYRVGVEENFVLDVISNEKLYSSKDAAVRELIQNAMDACRARRKREAQYQPAVYISYTEESNEKFFTIVDAGSGMTRDIIVQYFINAGKSLYQSEKYLYSKNRFCNAGYYGIGVYSVFMITDEITVITHPLSPLNISEKEYSFIFKNKEHWIKLNTSSILGNPGTAISFKLKPGYESGTALESIAKLKQYILETFLNTENIRLFLSAKSISNKSIINIEGAIKDEEQIKLKSPDEILDGIIYNRKAENAVNIGEILSGIEGKVQIKKVIDEEFYYNSENSTFTKTPFDSMSSDLDIIVIQIESNKNENRYNLIIKKDDYDKIQHPDIPDSGSTLNITSGQIIDRLSFSSIQDETFASLEPQSCSAVIFPARYHNKGFRESKESCDLSGCSGVVRRKYFLHGICVNEAHIPIRPRGCDVLGAVININDNITIPMIDREGFSVETSRQIREAIEFAVECFLNKETATYILNKLAIMVKKKNRFIDSKKIKKYLGVEEI